MAASEREGPAERLRVAFEMFELGVAMMRARLAREGLDEAAIDGRVQAWLLERPGAEHGDAVGRPR